MTPDGKCDKCGGQMARLSGGSGYVCLNGDGKVETAPPYFRAYCPVIQQNANPAIGRILSGGRKP